MQKPERPYDGHGRTRRRLRCGGHPQPHVGTIWPALIVIAVDQSIVVVVDAISAGFGARAVPETVGIFAVGESVAVIINTVGAELGADAVDPALRVVAVDEAVGVVVDFVGAVFGTGRVVGALRVAAVDEPSVSSSTSLVSSDRPSSAHSGSSQSMRPSASSSIPLAQSSHRLSCDPSLVDETVCVVVDSVGAVLDRLARRCTPGRCSR